MAWSGNEGVCFKILIIFLSVTTVFSQSNYCNVNGNIHQVGESWTTATGNNILKKCTCARKGQWNCAYVKEDALMVVADVSGIKKVKLSDGAGFNMPFIRDLAGRTVAVDVDVESDTIYWTDVSYNGRGIYKATFSNGHNVRRFIHQDVFEPNGLAFDWLAKNIYWTDAQLGAIYAARENGQHRTMVVGGLAEPRAIVVLPLRGLMFWSDQSDGTIESASMDGSGRKVIIQGLGWPNEIAVDATRSKIYWIDGKKRTIESCDFDGTSWDKVLDFSIAFDSPGFGLSLFGGRLYFSVWDEKSVYSVTALGQDLRVVLSDMDEYVGGVAIINQKIQQAPISNNVGLCRKHLMPCSHICLPQSRGSYTCACPEKSGLVLSYDMHTCREPKEFILYTSVYDGTIMMVSKDLGSQPKPVMLAQGDQPSAIDYDPVDQMVYWSDVATNAIHRMHLNGSAYDIFLQDGIGVADGIAVDWVNRYLYFTNYGWEEENKPFGRIEIIKLDRSERKVLIHEDLNKPRDIVIDQEKGFMYYSDWGADAKIVRADLDGRNPHIIPIDVENPNGLSLDDGVLFITDSHRKSALIQVNGTIVYGRPPSLIKYDTILERTEENMDLGLEIPFGIAMDGKSVYLTDWGTGKISEIDINTGIPKTFLEGIKKPTGIVRTSKKPQKTYVNDCMKDRKCSHVCVPVDQTFSSCICPDHIGKAMSENEWNCVAPDRFTLIADVNKILMLSESPADPTTYMVVRTFDDYSNIVAIAYDPLTYYVYWADNGRQRICRKMLGSPLGGDGGTSDDIEVVYTEIEMVEGMALDAENRLLYWTDGVLGTIEVIDLNGMTHATVLEHLIQPRAIALDTNMGMMYWTEWGRAAMVMTSKMNGYDLRPLMTKNLEWPNALYYDDEEDKVYVADGAKLKIESISSIEGDILDYLDLNGTVDHLFGVGKMGSYVMFTDWASGSLYKRGLLESAVLIKNLTRPTQIYTHSGFIPRIISQCSTAVHECSHICVPSPGSYTCLCPDHLVLAANLRNCVRPENLHLHTTTLEPPVFEEEYTTMPWAEEVTQTEPELEEHTLKIERLPDPTTPANLSTIVIKTTTAPVTNPTTVEISTAEQTTATTIPPPPRFPFCQDLEVNETANFTVPLFSDLAYVDLNASLLGLRALDVMDKDLAVSLVKAHFARVYPGEHQIQFTATDSYNRTIFCNTTVTVIDTTPPRVLYCPGDMDIEAYDDEKTTFVTWMEPQFADNSGTRPSVFNSHKQGHFLDGLHNVTYTAYDDAGNAATCSFLLAVIHRRARCGSPWSPPHSHFTCHTDQVTGDQVCQITCEDDYRLSLKTPFIRCRDDLDKFSIDWLPFLDDNVCNKPEIGNPQQVVVLEYPCPCNPTSTFYDYAYQIMTRRLREAVDCIGRTHSLGLCVNAEKKLRLECVDNSKVDFQIKVDLAQVSEVASMAEAKRIVKRSVTDILDKAVAGKIKARGSDMRDYPASEEAKLSDVKILCKNGYKGVEDGCIACPRGTYWHNFDCEFCPLHSFQERAAMSKCMNCSKETGTRNIGSTHRTHCLVMTRAEDESKVSVIVIVAAAIGGIILIGILMSVVVTCWYKKKRRKQEEWMQMKRKNRYRRHGDSTGAVNPAMLPVVVPGREDPREIPNATRARTVSFEDDYDSDISDGRASKRSSGSGKRVTIKEETIEHSIPNRKDAAKQKSMMPKSLQPNWRMALVLRNTAVGKKKAPKAPKAPSSVASEDACSDAEPTSEVDDERSMTSALQSETETDRTMTDGQTTDNETSKSDTEGIAPSESDASTLRANRRLMSSTSDLGDETMSMTSGASSRATTPIKGVLKKPKRIMSMDDSLVSDSTITNTIENARISTDARGRDRLRRSQRNGRSVSPNLEARQKQPLGIRRSLSFDRGPSAIGPGPHKLFERDPRYLTVGGRPRPGMPPLRPGMPPLGPGMPGPNNDAMMQPPRFPPGVRPPFMGGPRMMTRPPPGAVLYRHPNHPNMRMAFVPMSQGGRPMRPGRMPMPPPYSTNWKGPYDGPGDWENISVSGSEMDLRNPPRHMVPPRARMGFPPRSMYPRVRLPNGAMIAPPRYQGRFAGPGQPRFPPQAGYFSDASMMSG